MANENVCVFCGQKPGTFRTTGVVCAGTYQTACKSCEKELRELDEAEKCRRALRLGLADFPHKLQERIEVITEAENHRPACLRCGSGLKFGLEEQLDNSPLRDSVFSTTFDVLPAYCESCGKYEFYNPVIARKNKYIAHLIHKDTAK